MSTGNSWTSAQIAKLKALLARGLSTSEIGRKLGMTKNAIVGKINRLKLNSGTASKPAKVKVAAKKPAPAKAEPKKTAKKEPAKKKSDKSDMKRKTERLIRQTAELMGLKADQCRWPIGDPDADDFHFCAEKCFPGKPYCFAHCKTAYQFQPIRKK